jgi:4-amino-4-deoxy-L-arabinose transferase-like glycosyltransferase
LKFEVGRLKFILIAYLAVGILYAVKTPPWEVPDEPAHYNYIKYLAENYRFPVLQMGDYPHDYLEEIKARQFPPGMSIEPLRYEFHQPPLYYILAAVVYKLFAGSLLPLRLLSVLLGCCLLWVAYHVVKEIFPGDEALALGTTAFVAFVPMHIAMTAVVNNDTLAELILAGILWMLVRYVKLVRWSDGQMVGWSKETPDHRTKDHLTTGPMGRPTERVGQFIWLGVLMGLGLLTKITTLVAVPLALVAVLVGEGWLEQRRESGFARRFLLPASFLLLPAILLTLPWFARNTLVYGGLDIWGLGRHDAIVVGQPRTAEWLAQLGTTGLAKEFILTTFKSFWAQFGWMGILVDQRIYLILALFCAVAGLGLALFIIRNNPNCSKGIAKPVVSEAELSPLWAWSWRSGPSRMQQMLTPSQRIALGLLALSTLFTLLSYLWYNLKLVQHQGRYLFPALIPIGLAFALGLREVLTRDNARTVALLFLAGVLILAAKGLVTGDFNKLITSLLGGAAIAFGIKALLPERYDDRVFALPYLGLLVLDLICLFKFIVPYFQQT